MYSAMEKVMLARDASRPKITDYIENLFTDFFEQKGDMLEKRMEVFMEESLFFMADLSLYSVTGREKILKKISPVILECRGRKDIERLCG